MVHQRQQRRQFTCTLDSGRLIFTATSSRMKMSGYLVLENSPSRTSSWARVKVVRSRRCFRWFMPVRIKQREKKVRKARLGCTRFGETFDRRRLVRGHDSVIFVDPPPARPPLRDPRNPLTKGLPGILATRNGCQTRHSNPAAAEDDAESEASSASRAKIRLSVRSTHAFPRSDGPRSTEPRRPDLVLVGLS
jgi:hypothetical protein